MGYAGLKGLSRREQPVQPTRTRPDLYCNLGRAKGVATWTGELILKNTGR